MTPAIAVAVLLAGVLALGAGERLARDRALRRVRIRVHVNGTRGKSTVTRLIAAALRAAGIRTLAKTTGTSPRLILPDGTERTIRRRAPASIREQLWVLRQASRLGVEALVVECMALDPALQDASERQMVRATIGVITNVRPDHGDVMGLQRGEVAASLAHGVPDAAVLVLGEPDDTGALAREARRRATRLVQAGDDGAIEAGTSSRLPAWQRRNVEVALAVTRELGVPDAIALPAMLAAPADPGAVARMAVTIGGRPLSVIDGSAANDPESLGLILADPPAADDCLFVFNHRADRPLRLRQFAASPLWRPPGVAVLLTGDAPDWRTRRIVDAALGRGRVEYTRRPGLATTLRRCLTRRERVATIVFCGNSKNLDVNAVLHAAAGTAS